MKRIGRYCDKGMYIENDIHDPINRGKFVDRVGVERPQPGYLLSEHFIIRLVRVQVILEA